MITNEHTRLLVLPPSIPEEPESRWCRWKAKVVLPILSVSGIALGILGIGGELVAKQVADQNSQERMGFGIVILSGAGIYALASIGACAVSLFKSIKMRQCDMSLFQETAITPCCNICRREGGEPRPPQPII